MKSQAGCLEDDGGRFGHLVTCRLAKPHVALDASEQGSWGAQLCLPLTRPMPFRLRLVSFYRTHSLDLCRMQDECVIVY